MSLTRKSVLSTPGAWKRCSHLIQLSIGASRPGNNSNDVTSLPLQRHQCRIVAVRDGRRELAAVTAGIPTRLDPAQPPEPARAQDQPVQRPGPTIMWATVLCAGVWGVALLALGE